MEWRRSCNKKINPLKESNAEESQYLFNLRNDHIVHFKGICCSLNALVMEYCRFGSVRSLFGTGKLTEQLKYLICYDCAKGMKVMNKSLN